MARRSHWLELMNHSDLSARRKRLDALADDIATLAASIAASTNKLLAAIREFDAERGWALQGAKSMAVWLCWRTGCAIHTAREWVRCARALGGLPKIDEAMGKGAVSYSKVRAMTRVAAPENEDLLLDQAKTASGDRLEKICSAFRSVKKKIDPESAANLTDDDHRYVRRRAKRDGTIVLEIRCLPDEADTIQKAIEAMKAELEAEQPQTESVPAGTSTSCDSEDLDGKNVPAETAGTRPGVSKVDAVVALAHRQLAAVDARKASADGNETPIRPPSATRRELLLHLRTSDLVEGAFAAELHDGTPLDGATFCRLACDTGLVVAHTDDQGSPLDVGRRRRTIPPALRRALLIRDRECTFPGCNHQAFLEGHHLEHWSRGGATNKDNLALLCPLHHVALHEGGFSAERCADTDTFLFRDPDGRPIPHHPPPATPQPTPPIDDPKINLIDWDGRPIDHQGAVFALVNRHRGGVR